MAHEFARSALIAHMRILALALATIVGCAPVTGSSPTLPLTATPTPTAPATTTADASATATVPTRTSVAATPSQLASQRPSPSIVISGDVVSSSASRVAADPNAAKRAATGIQALALDLYRELAVERTNLAFSPYSAASALAMTRVGAAGRTAQEMDQVLHAAQIGDVDAAFNALDLALAKRAGSYPSFGGASLDLATANRLWAQRDFHFENAFLDGLSAYYGAGVGVVDFVNARDAARGAINKWVSDRTKARIPELVKDGILDELTRFVLTNAIYMKAQWTRPFPKTATKAAPFRRLDGTEVSAQLMADFKSFPYAKSGEIQAIGLPYVGGLSMVAIVPDAGTFAAFERSMDAQRISSIVDALQFQAVDLRFPRFTFRTAAPLKPALTHLGMRLAFTEAADFSGISRQEHLILQNALQETFIAVDEEGTEATAATAFFGGATGGPSQWVELTVDRPFLFLVRDDETGAILFLGRVLDPTAG
ncbi:MAG: serpin family protein [Chloroflexi bacterium]|nr:MAG: serpin family protein [Chloroflexota bacterium]TMC28850.1 MAG: serpin family protein [Chloroflexota bacterium]